MRNQKNKKPFKTLKIEGDYNDFQTFYDRNKKLIYDSIFDTLSGFVVLDTKRLSLFVSSKIKDECWETEFNFKRNDYPILKRDLMPFYEQVEDYEMCEKIIKLHEKLVL